MSTASTRTAITGNEAVAYAMRQINPDVVAAYPITPQTEIVQIFSTFVADGLADTEFVTVESEHSAMSATIGAAAAGARAMTATSSQGLALMWEMVYIAASLRLPVVMPVVNRALSAPINIHCDHSDTMGCRDSGWIQLFSESAQEAYDNVIQAVRIAENPDVLLPCMVTMDGFIVSHALDNAVLLDDDAVRRFIGGYKPAYNLLDFGNPITVGALDFADWYFEHKRQEVEAETHVFDAVLEVAADYERLSGRRCGLFEAYRMEDAAIAIVVLGSTAGTARVVVDSQRERGKKAGMLKLRVFRPFPEREIAHALAGCRAVGVMDRAESFSNKGGPVFTDVRAALFQEGLSPRVVNYVYGLGGRDINTDQIEQVYVELDEVARTGKTPRAVTHLGVRE